MPLFGMDQQTKERRLRQAEFYSHLASRYERGQMRPIAQTLDTDGKPLAVPMKAPSPAESARRCDRVVERCVQGV